MIVEENPEDFYKNTKKKQLLGVSEKAAPLWGWVVDRSLGAAMLFSSYSKLKFWKKNA